MAVNYTIEYTPLTVNANESWGQQDVDGNGGVDSGLIPLLMKIIPNEGYTVSAIDFSIAGQQYSELDTNSNNFIVYIYNEDSLPLFSLPDGVNKVSFNNTAPSVGGIVPYQPPLNNTVEVNAWLDSDYELAGNNIELILDIDGDAKPQLELEPIVYWNLEFQPSTIAEGDYSQLVFSAQNGSNTPPTGWYNITPEVVNTSTTATGSDVASCAGFNFNSPVVQNLTCSGNVVEPAEFLLNFNQPNAGGQFMTWYKACEDSEIENEEYLTVKLPAQDLNGYNTGELEATLTILSSQNDTIYGCTDPSATNYNPQATSNDGSCIILGCTDASASNFNSLATIDDGTCEYPTASTNITVTVDEDSNLSVYAFALDSVLGVFSNFEVTNSGGGTSATVTATPIESENGDIGLMDCVSWIIAPNDGYVLSRRFLNINVTSEANGGLALNYAGAESCFLDCADINLLSLTPDDTATGNCDRSRFTKPLWTLTDQFGSPSTWYPNTTAGGGGANQLFLKDSLSYEILPSIPGVGDWTWDVITDPEWEDYDYLWGTLASLNDFEGNYVRLKGYYMLYDYSITGNSGTNISIHVYGKALPLDPYGQPGVDCNISLDC